MKLATLQDGSRDGQLVVVSRDLAQAHFATHAATRLQQLLDDWNFISPQLEDLYATLNGGKARHAFAFDPRLCMAPLPRAYQRLDAAVPAHPGGPEGGGAPQMLQRPSDDFLGPCDDAVPADAAPGGLALEVGIAALTGDVAPGVKPAQALESVRLLMLVCDWRLPPADASGLAVTPAFLSAHRGSACSPLAVTPDELGPAWQGGRVHLPLDIGCNGRRGGSVDAGTAMAFHFGQLIAQAAGTRRLRNGSLVGSGALGPALPPLQPGDTLRVEMKGADGASVFGAIEQRLAGPA